MPRALARRARSMASMERATLSGSQCAWMSITPSSGPWPHATCSRRAAAPSMRSPIIRNSFARVNPSIIGIEFRETNPQSMARDLSVCGSDDHGDSPFGTVAHAHFLGGFLLPLRFSRYLHRAFRPRPGRRVFVCGGQLKAPLFTRLGRLSALNSLFVLLAL